MITSNISKVSSPHLTIGKGGVTIFQGNSDPSSTYSTKSGDMWINPSTLTIQLRSVDNASWKPTQNDFDWEQISNTPTTLSGYGITDAIQSNTPIVPGTGTKITFDTNGLITAATTLSDTDIPNLSWSKITSGTPTTLSGYGITDALSLGGGTLTGYLTLHSDPTNPYHSATKQYVDNAITGLDKKQSVRVATTGNITLSGLQTIDGVSVVEGDRVLVKNQNTGSENGLYTASSGSWTRSSDADGSVAGEVTANLYTFVEEGDLYANTGWSLITNNPITVGSTSLVFAQFTGLGQVDAGAGLTKNGDQLNIGTASTSRIVVNTDSIDLAQTAVTPGSGYNTFTVDAYGRITGASTSAYLTENQTITISGDATGTGKTSLSLTLASTGVTAATYGSASKSVTYTVDAKGRITSASEQNIAITAAQVSGLASVATSGSYNDLSNKPSIINNLAGLTDVALSSPQDWSLLRYNSSSEKWVNLDTRSDILEVLVDKRKGFYEWADFANDLTTLTTGQSGTFLNINRSYSTDVNNADPFTSLDVGVISMETVVASGRVDIGTQHNFCHLSNLATSEISCLIRVDSLSNGTNSYVIEFGFTDTIGTSNSVANGAYFRYTHSSNSGYWQCITSASSTQTVLNSSVSPTTSKWQKLTVKVYKNGANTEASFKITDSTNDVTIGPITTNLPVAFGQHTGIGLKIRTTNGTANHKLFVDYISAYGRYASLRY